MISAPKPVICTKYFSGGGSQSMDFFNYDYFHSKKSYDSFGGVRVVKRLTSLQCTRLGLRKKGLTDQLHIRQHALH